MQASTELNYTYMQQIHELDEKTMSQLQLLADTNVKIGEARGILADLEATKDNYLEEREKATIAKIADILRQSTNMIEQMNSNYTEIKSFHDTVISMVTFLSDIQTGVSNVVADFADQQTLFEEYVNQKETEFSSMQQNLELQTSAIKADKASIAQQYKSIAADKALIESRQQQIISAMKTLDAKKNKK